MQVPLEIAFHNTESSEWAEDEIRGRVAELEEIYGRLISCRVRVDQRAENRAGTIPPVVRIELRIPGHKDLVVSHEPEHLLRKYQRPDLRNAIHEAFRIAQRRLQQRGESKCNRDVDHRGDRCENRGSRGLADEDQQRPEQRCKQQHAGRKQGRRATPSSRRRPC